MDAANIKHDWYQTDSQVVVDVLAKNLEKEKVIVDFASSIVTLKATLPNDSNYELQLNLCHPIKPDESSFRILTSKVELKLKKLDGVRWSSLEGSGSTPSFKSFEQDGKKLKPLYSNKNWDKIEAEAGKEDEDEKLEGDAELNKMFQKIYSEGSDEVKKAMKKSFVESGGTVLSTNWKEVGEKKIEVKPPEGMEWKNWEK